VCVDILMFGEFRSMLKSLEIRNIATIESVSVDFNQGMNVLTGETGAGKSIVVGGLELALGDRVTSDVIRSGENLAVAEAYFIPPFPEGIDTILKSDLGLECQRTQGSGGRRSIRL